MVCSSNAAVSEEEQRKVKKVVTFGSKKGINIGVLTSGGDSQGMNAALKGVVRLGMFLGCKVFLINEGYQGMIDGGDNIVEATWAYVSSIIQLGGTVIGSARCMSFKERSGRLIAAKNLLKHDISKLIVIGGDGSLTGADIFKKEWPQLIDALQCRGDITPAQGHKHQCLDIVGIVGSIDNDFCGTDMTIGTDSALHRIIESVDTIVSTANSHRRIFVLEIMGRHCGYLAVVAALASEADFVFVPECPVPLNWPEKLCKKLTQSRSIGDRLNIVLVSEGAIDIEGKPVTCNEIATVIKQKINEDTRVTVLGHLQRGGNPSAFDRIIGIRMGAEAVVALMEMEEDSKPIVVVLDGTNIKRAPLMPCVEKTKAVTTAMDEKNFDLAAELRGKAFKFNMESYKMLAKHEPHNAITEGGGDMYAVALIHVGAPACGMNAVVKCLVRCFLNRGYIVYGIKSGFDGLLDEKIYLMKWAEVIGWVGLGGCALGTTRTLPEKNMKAVAEILEKYKIQALMVIGGFEAFHAATQLLKARNEYKALCIPIAVIPCTINNNVPGTDLSLGCDSALNEIAFACDQIRQSAFGAGKRVFIIEVMGGYCGYLASFSGIICGAEVTYIHEEQFSLKDVAEHLRHTVSKIRSGAEHSMIIRNEYACEFYSTDFLHRLYSREGRGIFTTKMNQLGHMQQGGSPSPFDRHMGIILACEAVEWMVETLQKCTQKNTVVADTDDTVVVIGLLRSQPQCTPITELIDNADFDKRVPLKQWWIGLRPLMRIISRNLNCYEPGKVYQEEFI